MSEKQKIQPKIILILYTKNIGIIHFIVKDIENNILHLDTIEYIPYKLINTISLRRQVVDKSLEIINEYNVDTIILEKTKLFTDGIAKYPDPEVYKNVLLNFGIQISIEDKFINIIKYLFEIPYKDWTETVLNSKQKYILDQCKNHISILNELTDEQEQIVNQYNFYQALCFSDVIKHNNIISKKYLVK